MASHKPFGSGSPPVAFRLPILFSFQFLQYPRFLLPPERFCGGLPVDTTPASGLLHRWREVEAALASQSATDIGMPLPELPSTPRDSLAGPRVAAMARKPLPDLPAGRAPEPGEAVSLAFQLRGNHFYLTANSRRVPILRAAMFRRNHSTRFSGKSKRTAGTGHTIRLRLPLLHLWNLSSSSRRWRASAPIPGCRPQCPGHPCHSTGDAGAGRVNVPWAPPIHGPLGGWLQFPSCAKVSV